MAKRTRIIVAVSDAGLAFDEAIDAELAVSVQNQDNELEFQA